MKLLKKLGSKAKKVTVLMTGAIVAMIGSATAAFAASPAPVVPDFTGVNVGFTPANLLSGATGFYTLFIGFILLVLSVKFAPAMIGFLFTIIAKARGGKA
jgi:hypothetical protein